MMALLILCSYILSIFIGRYLDIKLQIYKDPIHYKGHIVYGIWFIPIINILMPFVEYIDFEISCRRTDCKHNAFINWFFVGINYKTKASKKADKELDEFFKFKKKHTVRNLTEPNKKLDGSIK